jgi:hypothetical protein
VMGNLFVRVHRELGDVAGPKSNRRTR